MTRTVGILLGALLMPGVFLLVLSTGNSPTLVKEVVSSEADMPTQATESIATGDAPVENAIDSVVHLAAHETDDHNDATAESRYRVWSSFRSEWAAQGFARRLAAATDVPVEVVNEGPGNYQVVFRYRDDGERQAIVKRIETVTGLELE